MKQYNGEKAIISLTSWKARIGTVAKTIYSLIKQCPGFHIVLVLSEEEFPQKESELPENLMLFVDNDLVEILWVYENWKSFKKVLPTMEKYKHIPIISADDGCIYIRNYAQELYDKWLSNKANIISENYVYRYGVKILMGGCGVLYPPHIFKEYTLKYLTYSITNTLHDDGFIGCLIKALNIPVTCLYNASTFKKNKTFVDNQIAKTTRIWNNSTCSDSNIPNYKKLLNLC